MRLARDRLWIERSEKSASGEIPEISKGEEKSMPGETGEKTSRPYRGRHFAEYVRAASEADHRMAIQDALDAGSKKGWHLVGVEGGPPNYAAILFWDIEPPNFARTSRGR